MQWGGVTRVAWHASAYVRVSDHSFSTYVTLVTVDLSSKRGYMHHPLSEKVSSEFHSFAVCLLFCAVIMVIKECKAHLQELLQNYKLGY